MIWPLKKQQHLVLPDELREDLKFTPDLWFLEQYVFQNVFMYNECLPGARMFMELMDGNVTPQHKAFTADKRLVLYKRCLGRETTAFALRIKDDQVLNEFSSRGQDSLFGPTAPILGQIFTMRPKQIRKLDKYLQNTVQFQRERVKLEIPFRYVVMEHGKEVPEDNQRVETVSAWMYVANQDFWMDLLGKQDLCKPAKLYTANKQTEFAPLNRYYFWNDKLESNSG